MLKCVEYRRIRARKTNVKKRKKKKQKTFLSKLMIRRKRESILLIQPFVFTLSFPFCESQSDEIEQRKKKALNFKYRVLNAVCVCFGSLFGDAFDH